MLADEVGLGKTVVAQKLVGKACQKNEDTAKILRVFYVCPNLTLASQNTSRLLPPDLKNKKRIATEDRLSLLHKEEVEDKIKIYSLTPGTSLQMEKKRGNKEEKKLLYFILKSEEKDPNSAEDNEILKMFLRGYRKYGTGVGEEWAIDEHEFTEVDKQVLKKELLETPVEGVKIENINSGYILKKIIRELKTGNQKRFEKLKQIRGNPDKKEEIKQIFRGLMKDALDEKFDGDYWKIRGKLIKSWIIELCKIYVSDTDNEKYEDLIIFDEFHKYNDVVVSDDRPEIVKTLIEETKILLMSATPYPSYSRKTGEHYESLREVLSFLEGGLKKEEDKGITKKLLGEENCQRQGDLNDYHSRIKELVEDKQSSEKKQSDVSERIKPEEKLYTMKKEIENELKKIMVRTERYHFISNKEKGVKPLGYGINGSEISSETNLEFMSKNRKIRKKGFLEYFILNPTSGDGGLFSTPTCLKGQDIWKSGSHLLSFMSGDYKDIEKLFDSKNHDSDKKEEKITQTNKKYSLMEKVWDLEEKTDDVRYIFQENQGMDASETEIQVSNEKLAYLIEQIIPKDRFYLWTKPTHMYYQTDFFPTTEDDQYDPCAKMLVFSGWKFVPDYISGMLSYFWEKKIGDLKNRRDFKKTDNFTESNFLYPSIFLADQNIFFSELLCKDYFQERKISNFKKSFTEIICCKINELLGEQFLKENSVQEIYCKKENLFRTLLYLDCLYSKVQLETDSDKESTEIPNKYLAKMEDMEYSYSGQSLSDNNYSEMKKTIKENLFYADNKSDASMDSLIEIGLFSPSINILRSLWGVLSKSKEFGFESKLASINDDFIEFNLDVLRRYFESKLTYSAIVNSFEKDSYREKIIKYSKEAQFPAVIDEYMYLLYEKHQGKDESVIEVSKKIIEELNEVIGIDSGGSTYYKFKKEDSVFMRDRSRRGAKFGMSFKKQQAPVDEEDAEDDNAKPQVFRSSSVRKAFNSPFFPFVLITTSVGQEGLDFHYYCRDIVHWNLPSNPVSLEQREGRINRYKDKLVRENVISEVSIIKKLMEEENSDCLKEQFERTIENLRGNNSWDAIFDIVEKFSLRLDRYNRGLFPNWLFGVRSFQDPQKDNCDSSPKQIRRHVPVQLLSKDVAKYRDLINKLACYRLAFGQARQEDFLEDITKCLPDQVEENECEDPRYKNMDLLNRFTLNLSPKTPAEYVKWYVDEHLTKIIESAKDNKHSEEFEEINRTFGILIRQFKNINNRSEEKPPPLDCRQLAEDKFQQIEKIITPPVDLKKIDSKVKHYLKKIIYYVNPFVEIANYLEGGYEDDKEVLKNGLEEYLENDS